MNGTPQFIIKMHSGEAYIFEAPPDWTLETLVSSIRALGHFCDGKIFISQQAIALIAPMGVKLHEPAEVVQFQPKIVPASDNEPPQPDHTPEPAA